MNNTIWHNIEYSKVNKFKEHYANQKGACSFTMLAPSDVPTHFFLEEHEGVIEISFRYAVESEKVKDVRLVKDVISARVGKNSKKIYYLKIDTKELKKLLSVDSQNKHMIRAAVEDKVKNHSYTAIKEIFKKYIQQDLKTTQQNLAF